MYVEEGAPSGKILNVLNIYEDETNYNYGGRRAQ